MNLEQLISPSIPTLSGSDSGTRALDLMQDNNVSQLPLVTDDQYVALIQENDVLDWDEPQTPLEKSDLLNYKPAMSIMAHPFEALRIFDQMNLSILPVVDNDHKYLGSITKDSLLKYITENSGILNPGGIIVLEIAPRNYTLYDIARICENEDVIILNLQVHTNEQGMLEVTLKLNRSGLDAVVSSFERHEYKVLEVYGEQVNKEDITDKYRLLMNYLNM